MRRLIAVTAAAVVQLWSVAPMAASVIYCIGEDGHSGFELVRAGARGCASCCHEEDGGGEHFAASPVSECVDIALAPSAGVTAKLTPSASPGPGLAADTYAAPGLRAAGLVREMQFDPPRASLARLRRHTVLLI